MTELVSELESRYRLASDPEDRALVGFRGSGLTAALGVVRYPHVFGKAALQSVSLEDVARHAPFEQLADKSIGDTLVYFEWSRYEAHDSDRGYDYGAYGEQLATVLCDAGCRVVGGQVQGSHGWAGWRAHSRDWLVALFPSE